MVLVVVDYENCEREVNLLFFAKIVNYCLCCEVFLEIGDEDSSLLLRRERKLKRSQGKSTGRKEFSKLFIAKYACFIISEKMLISLNFCSLLEIWEVKCDN